MRDDPKHDTRDPQARRTVRSTGARAKAKAGSDADRMERPDTDDGPLESIGKAVSSPLLGSEEAERAKDPPSGRSGRKPGRSDR